MTKRSDIIVIARATAKPGDERALEQALRAVAAPTRKQPGCMEFQLLRDASEPSVIVGFERWASEADHQKHLAGPHVRELMRRMAPILAAPPSIASYEMLDA